MQPDIYHKGVTGLNYDVYEHESIPILRITCLSFVIFDSIRCSYIDFSDYVINYNEKSPWRNATGLSVLVDNRPFPLRVPMYCRNI